MWFKILITLCAMNLGGEINNCLFHQQEQNPNKTINFVVWKLDHNLSMNPLEYHKIEASELSKNTTDEELLHKVVTTLLKSQNINSGKNEVTDGDTEFDIRDTNDVRASDEDLKEESKKEPVVISEMYSKSATEYTFSLSREENNTINIQIEKVADAPAPLYSSIKKKRKVQPIQKKQNLVHMFLGFLDVFSFATIASAVFVLVLARLRIWKVKLQERLDTSSLETGLKIIEDLEKEVCSLKSAMEQYAIDTNDKMRYLLLKLLSLKEQVHTTRKENEDFVIFRFIHYSNGLMTRVKKIEKKMKINQKLLKWQKAVHDKEMFEIRNQLKLLRKDIEYLKDNKLCFRDKFKENH